jgi:S1-C subfamily serine protease
VWISIDQGPDRGKRAEVKGPVFTIGRHPESNFVLTSNEASSRHAAIETAADGSFMLRDLGSTNGTYVNGMRIQGAVPITGTEQVSIGQDVVRLTLRSPDATVIRTEPPIVPPPRPAPVAPAPLAPAPLAPAPLAPPAVAAGGLAAASAPPGGTPPPLQAPPAGPPAGPPPAGGARRGPPRFAPVVVLVILAGIGVGIYLATKSSGTKALTQTQIIADASPSVIRIQGAQGAGSGFVINAKKELVVTNAHVVVGNSALMGQVGNNTNETSPLQVVAADPCNDLAVLKFTNPLPKLKALTLGSSSALKPGDSVTVLGYPGSLQQSLNSDETTGQATSVVSNTGTVSQLGVKANPDPSLPQYNSLIVHQAPVNHGDSGGPLLNSDGNVVGINTLTNTNNQGQYYAIAINYAKQLLPGLEGGQSRNNIGWDLSAVQANDPNLQSELLGLYQSLPAYAPHAQSYATDLANAIVKDNVNGMFDGGDQTGSPADTAHLAGYLLTSINGDSVPNMTDVCNVVSSLSPGSQAKVVGNNIAAGNPQELGAALQTTLTIPSH